MKQRTNNFLRAENKVTLYQKWKCMVYLQPQEVLWFEVIWGTSAPINYVLILALAAQLAVPVCHPEVVVYQGVTGMAVLQDSVEKGL